VLILYNRRRSKHRRERDRLWCRMQALAVRKDDAYVLVARARTYAKMGIVKESLDDVNAVLKEYPDNHQVRAASYFI